ncbi:DinB family protein [Sphingobacterium athyrii]|uniref:DinB family protein n=1 Tax=Sphingobacterium athyrii TaxID=2152717 RepID=A0A363NP62_9SPHI|nr:DinB family protein [Sphingobacterium athyrii]PUV22582.1 DinB family protein [Sphingobacterium athyrii]
MENVEVWMRGPIAGIPDLLQPVAHALLQAEEDIVKYTAQLSSEQLWARPCGNASIGFHLLHIRGVIDRMFTYAAGKALSAGQFDYLRQEGVVDMELNVATLVENLQLQIEQALQILAAVNPDTLTEERFLGRKRIPTTLIGLLFHAAEHAQRHVGQLIVTVRCVK